MRGDRFLCGYVAALLWAETDNDDVPLEENHDVDAFSNEAWNSIVEDCRKFRENPVFQRLLDDSEAKHRGQSVEDFVGHDFWLTRKHHGTGFWDGDWSEAVGKEATKVAQSFREVSPYVGDDGRIYLDGLLASRRRPPV